MADEHPQRWPLVCIMGPTAVGKTELAMAVADTLAEQWPGVDLISVDAVQVYRGMDIGSAKPDAATRKRYPHALVDIRSPLESYDAWQFCQDAVMLMQDSRRRGRIPVLVGGSMFYFAALLHGLDDLPSADAGLRAELEEQGAELGWPTLHQQLRQLDPAAADRIQPQDAQRIVRALELHRLGAARAGTSSQADARNKQRATPALGAEWLPLKFALYDQDRQHLHEQIARRARQMLAQGLVAEVEALIASHAMQQQPASMRAVGYRQIWEHCHKGIAASELADTITTATRQLAKRQLTWLRNQHGMIWINNQGQDCRQFVAMRIQHESIHWYLPV